MSNYNKTENEDVENIDVESMNDEDISADMSNEDRELWKRAISDALELKIREIEEEIKDIEVPPPSDRHKI